jgi:hypothetical protein
MQKYLINLIILVINILHLVKTNISTNENNYKIPNTTENITTINLKNLTDITNKNMNINTNIDITSNSNIYNYDFKNLIQGVKYNLLPLSIKSPYQSENTCVTYQDQIEYNYTLSFYQYDYQGKIFPENFCYGLLTYNISRNDFSDIVKKNMSKFFF